METRPPTIGRILIAIGFAVSCFGLFLFLWIAFGGPVPLKAEGYKVTVPFSEASQLAEAADVRISGVSVGRVSRVERGAEGQAEATIELDARYAPIPNDTQAILRQKTLLGETYVELTPGSAESGEMPEGGELPVAQVSEAVQLDEVFRAFDERTRAAFQGWMQGSGGGAARPGRRPVGRDRQPRALRRRGRARAAPARHGAARGPPARPRGRRGVRGARRAPGPAPRPDREREHRVRNHGAAQRITGRGVHDLPDVPARVARDADSAGRVRRGQQPGRHRAAAGGARAGAHGARAERALARAARVLPRTARHDRRRAGRHAGDAAPAGRQPPARARRAGRLARARERDPRGRAPLPPRGDGAREPCRCEPGRLLRLRDAGHRPLRAHPVAAHAGGGRGISRSDSTSPARIRTCGRARSSTCAAPWTRSRRAIAPRASTPS